MYELAQNLRERMQKYKVMLDKTKKFLDGIDVLHEFLEYESIGVVDVMQRIEDKYNYAVKDDEVFEGRVFTWMSEDEFIDYLKCRYVQLNFSEVVTTYIYGVIDAKKAVN